MNNTGYKDCPSCGDLISETARACSCGWKKSKEKKSFGFKNCSFSDNGQQCPKLATVDDSTCRYHIDWWDSPRQASQVLQMILSGEIGQERNWRDDAIREFQNKHPEFKVIPRTKQEVVDILAMNQKFMKKNNLPYNKDKAVA